MVHYIIQNSLRHLKGGIHGHPIIEKLDKSILIDYMVKSICISLIYDRMAELFMITISISGNNAISVSNKYESIIQTVNEYYEFLPHFFAWIPVFFRDVHTFEFNILFEEQRDSELLQHTIQIMNTMLVLKDTNLIFRFKPVYYTDTSPSYFPYNLLEHNTSLHIKSPFGTRSGHIIEHMYNLNTLKLDIIHNDLSFIENIRDNTSISKLVLEAIVRGTNTFDIIKSDLKLVNEIAELFGYASYKFCEANEKYQTSNCVIFTRDVDIGSKSSSKR
jgi:hypothetical protein